MAIFNMGNKAETCIIELNKIRKRKGCLEIDEADST